MATTAGANLTSVTDEHGTSNNKLQIHRRVPGDGQIDSVTEPNDQTVGATTTLAYNAKGELGSINRPATLGDETFTYDSLSRPDLLTDGAGKTANYDFDGLDRLTKITYGDGSTVQYGYDE